MEPRFVEAAEELGAGKRHWTGRTDRLLPFPLFAESALKWRTLDSIVLSLLHISFVLWFRYSPSLPASRAPARTFTLAVFSSQVGRCR